MNMYLYKFSLISLLLFVGCKGQTLVTNKAHKQKIQTKLDQIREENELPGVNFAYVDAKGQVESFSAGFADLEAQTPMSGSHILFSGSIGKTYAVALLMQLKEEGKVDLKDKWLTYFPTLNWAKRLPNIDEITIEMLLQHTSGLPEYVIKPQLWKDLRAHPDKVWSYEDRLTHIFDDPPVHEAGKGWAYSDTNYILIGMLIEEITGSPYYEWLQKQLLDTFNLTETFPSLKREIPQLASGYSKLPPLFNMPSKVVSKGIYIFNPQVEWTGGGLNSSTQDLAKWAKIYFEAQAFSKSSLDMITRINPQGAQIPGGDAYGMGAFIYQTDMGVAYGHSGFMPGYNALFIYFPKQKTAAALQINCDYAGQKASLNSIMYTLLKIALEDA